MSESQFSRRQFLLTSGGATLLLPFMPSLLPRALAQDAKPPKRLIVLSHLYGHHTPHFFPGAECDVKLSDHTYYKRLQDIPGPLSTIFSSRFDGFRSKMNIYHGLDVITHTPDHNTTAALCAMGFKGPDGSHVPKHLARSIDVIAQNSPGVYASLPRYRSVRISTNWYGTRGFSWDVDGAGNPVHLEHLVGDTNVFNYLFGGLLPDAGTMTGGPNPHRLLVDRVLDRYKALRANSRMSKSDRERLDRHVATVFEVQERLEKARACGKPTFATYKNTDPKQTLWRNHIDSLVSALACDMTRVGVMLVRDYHSTKSDQAEHHGNSHSRDLNIQGAVDDAATYSTFKADQVHYLLTRLSQVIEADGSTLLDNSVVLWTAELSHGDAHRWESLPVATFGGAGGALKTGYYMDFRQRPHVRVRGDFPAMGQPYNRLLITLMRALGVTPTEYMKYGDGGGFGQFEPSPHSKGAYEKFRAQRNDTLPLIFT